MKTLKPGDIVLTSSNTLLGKLIKVFTRKIGESKTRVNHAGLIVVGGHPDQAIIVEALTTVKRRRLAEGYKDDRVQIAIYRPVDITDEELEIVVKEAESHVGNKYGYLKLITDLLDWVVFDIYFFRRLNLIKGRPICSYLDAISYAKIGRYFGKDPKAATPDDIWDYVTTHPQKYRVIKRLGNWNTAWVSKPKLDDKSSTASEDAHNKGE